MFDPISSLNKVHVQCHSYHQSRTKTKVGKIIHTTIRPTRNVRVSKYKTNKDLNNFHQVRRENDHDDRIVQASALTNKSSEEHQSKTWKVISTEKTPEERSSQVPYSKKPDTRLDHIEATNDHQRHHKTKGKKKCARQYILVAPNLILLVIILILAVLIPLVLIKPKTTTITSTPLLRWNSTGITVAGISGQLGNGTDQLYLPRGIAFDGFNALYVTDQKNNRVQKFMSDNSTGITITGRGNGTGSINLNDAKGPLGIAIDSNRNLYVCDNANSRVLLWPSNALSSSLLAGNGTAGNSTNQLNDPFGIQYDPGSSALYVADNANNRVMRFILNNTTGTLVAGGNGKGINSTQLSLPSAVYFDSFTNSLLIANTGAHNIVRWIIGTNNWTLVQGTSDGSNGTSPTRLYSPSDVKLDPMGNMYVVDRFNQRIQFFPVGDSSGTTVAGQTAVRGNDSMLLNFPTSLAFDNQLNMYVVDRGNHRIQKYLRY